MKKFFVSSKHFSCYSRWCKQEPQRVKVKRCEKGFALNFHICNQTPQASIRTMMFWRNLIISSNHKSTSATSPFTHSACLSSTSANFSFRFMFFFHRFRIGNDKESVERRRRAIDVETFSATGIDRFSAHKKKHLVAFFFSMESN